MSAGAPKPLITTLAPAPAKARAYASPMPLVEPVTTAFLPVKVPISSSLLLSGWGFAFVPRKIVSHHGFPGLRPFQPLFVTHRQMHVAHAGVPVLDHGNVGKIVVLGIGLIVLALVDEVHDRDCVLSCGLAQELDGRIV